MEKFVSRYNPPFCLITSTFPVKSYDGNLDLLYAVHYVWFYCTLSFLELSTETTSYKICSSVSQLVWFFLLLSSTSSCISKRQPDFCHCKRITVQGKRVRHTSRTCMMQRLFHCADLSEFLKDIWKLDVTAGAYSARDPRFSILKLSQCCSFHEHLEIPIWLR